jgi:hypothetical protein
MAGKLALLLLVHSWYPPACCADKHCFPIPCDEIAEVVDGYDWGAFHFYPVQTYQSLDSQCHACVAGDYPACLFIQKVTS